MKKILAMMLALIMVLSLVACGGGGDTDVSEDSGGDDAVKIAFLFPGPINDNGWNATAYKALEKFQGEGYETAYTENVKVDSIEEAFRNYAENGYDIIVGHGFEFGEPALLVCGDYPEVSFCITGKSPGSEADNVSFVDYKEFEAAYVAGMHAAAASESGKIGFIAGETNPTQLAGLAAFTNGARYINENIEIMGVVTGTFDDAAKGQETARAQIEAGADVVWQSCSVTGIGAIETASELGVKVGGNGEGQHDMFPDTMLGNYYTNTYELVASMISAALAGEGGGVLRPGYADGVCLFELWMEDAISAEEMELIEARCAEIIDGTYEVEEIHDRIDQ